ncbi:DUF222 domain-containing protein [Glaciihabitans sp. UYNi722]|uniref:HNH endonuclease signature motif containing protein n=1 Tax=Glaciihabitans sp. UYNi722 TaxID=3156344 RepID=UPI0033969B0D
MENLASTLRNAADAVARLGSEPGDIARLDDGDLIAAQDLVGHLQRVMQPYGAWVAGEIARRSRQEQGFDGLAKREGFIDAAALIQSKSGGTRAEAAKLVNIGTMITEVAAASSVAAASTVDGHEPPSVPWQQPVVAALLAGTLALDGAESIRKGLGGIDDAVAAFDLRKAAEILVEESMLVNADRLFARARQLRDELDAAGIARRERERRELRYFSVRRRPDGMVVGGFALADEDGQLLLDAYDSATSPRRGGPRFVEQADVERSDAMVADTRTPGQLAADAITELLRIGIDADPRLVLGRRRPSVRVVVSERVLHERAGHGRIEGASDPIAFETVERHLCSSGVIGIKFDDDGQCVNVGRDQRLFTERQRIGLAIRDAGCRVGDCDRPASWCEAHHIDYWARDQGKTDIAGGILLCRHHHMLIHDNHWEIIRKGGGYWLIPPKSVDIQQRPRSMPSKSAAMHDLSRELTAATSAAMA